MGLWPVCIEGPRENDGTACGVLVVLCPLKTLATALLAECAHLFERWVVALDGVVIIGAVFVALSLDVVFDTEE